jgi:uncharacterized membrane protein YGL010W
MPSLIKRFFLSLAGSKKAVAAVAAILIVLLRSPLEYLGLTITEQELQGVVLVLLVYIGGQGIADVGKEAKKVEFKAKRGGDV